MLKKHPFVLVIILSALVVVTLLLLVTWRLGTTHRIMTSDPNSYVELQRREFDSYQIVRILVKPIANLEAIREEVEKNCSSQCDIHMYDSVKAYQLDEEYQYLENPKENIKTDWKEKFIYLAEHKVALTNFDVVNIIRYPYKKSY